MESFRYACAVDMAVERIKVLVSTEGIGRIALINPGPCILVTIGWIILVSLMSIVPDYIQYSKEDKHHSNERLLYPSWQPEESLPATSNY